MFSNIIKLIFFIILAIGGAYFAITLFPMGELNAYIYGTFSAMMCIVGIINIKPYYLKITKGEKCYKCNGTGYVSVKEPFYGLVPDYNGERDSKTSKRVVEGYTTERKICPNCKGKKMLK
jgi:hypothetical protein